ncbi:MAG TPA: hypothetical protein VER32_03060 [Pyrinomonadaceae bacterium]|nr:hypothetical protein [Pyrinomonadaceae bacterium]
MATMTVKRVGVLSYAKISGIVTAGIGLIIGVFYGLFIMIFASAMSGIGGRGSASAAGFGIVGGLMAMVMIPVIYGIIGFLAGLVGGLIYNVAAGVVGGIELDLEETSPSFISPPPPTQPWAQQQPPYSSGQQPY